MEKEKIIEIEDLVQDQHNFNRGTKQGKLLMNNPQLSHLHPTMKPVRLFGRLVSNSSRPGNVILDTFGGSGTTIIACEQLGRKARLMELDPHYCDVIIARWEKLTGQKAVKLNP